MHACMRGWIKEAAAAADPFKSAGIGGLVHVLCLHAWGRVHAMQPACLVPPMSLTAPSSRALRSRMVLHPSTMRACDALAICSDASLTRRLKRSGYSSQVGLKRYNSRCVHACGQGGAGIIAEQAPSFFL